ncbi:MAG: methyltransferase [Calditrichaeota bacterium]|nr:MAG: methyltransferase [Calditrichota bacterium]
MNSRERVCATLRHEEPDKVPIDLGGMGSTGIMAMAYNRMKNHLGLSTKPTRISDMQQQLAEIEQEIIDYFQVDVISLENTFSGASNAWEAWRLPDGSPVQIHNSQRPVKKGESWVLMDGDRVKAHMPPSCLYFETYNPPLETATSIRDLEKYSWPYFTEEKLRQLEEKAKRLFEETDYAIMGNFGGSIVEYAETLRGWSSFMLDLVANPDFATALMDKLADMHLKNLEGYLQAVGPYIQIIQMGDDLGTQDGPQFSPDIYRALIQPYHKKLYQEVKQSSDIFVFFHSCGSVYDFMPDLIDAGIDILNPVQFTAAKMDSLKLKKEFGDQITYWGGGVDTQQLLPNGTPQDIARQVENQIKIFAPGGGFVFAAVHNIQSNVPVENILALYETANKTGVYHAV